MEVEDLWRRAAPQVLAALLRRSADVAACEDAVQEALLAAYRQWPRDGVPDAPVAWLVRVAWRRLIDEQRSSTAERARQMRVAVRERWDDVAVDPDSGVPRDDGTVQVLLLCAHPSLSDGARVALTLRAVCGLPTRDIAALLYLPESTVAQRISRAKGTLRREGSRLPAPTGEELSDRMVTVRHVVSLVFTAGHTTRSGTSVTRTDLTEEAMWLAERLHACLPRDAETAGLLALMLLTQARARARVDGHGELVPLGEQDRSRWDRDLIGRGVALVEDALRRGSTGPFQLQAAIAAVHAEAADEDSTDWLQITLLYRLLRRLAPSPAVSLGLASAIGMAHGPQAGLRALDAVRDERGMTAGHRWYAVQAHLLERAGRHAQARTAYATAARLTDSVPEQRYLTRKASQMPAG